MGVATTRIVASSTSRPWKFLVSPIPICTVFSKPRLHAISIVTAFVLLKTDLGQLTPLDNELLRVMGTQNVPAQTEADKERWNAGLNALVQELRKTGQGRDVSTIARRIAQYRREFIDDPTKTLRLDF